MANSGTNSFTALPLELKQAIWKLALPEDEPEVCIIWPLNPQYGPYKVVEPFVVDIAFPVLMHVGREWRNFVLSTPGLLRLRLSRQAGCQVPYRAFRPELDALFCSAFSFEQAIWCLAPDMDPGIKYSTLAKVRHLAVDWDTWIRAVNWLPQYVFRANQNLEQVSVVFPSSREGSRCLTFQAPARRCKLRPIENPGDIMVEKEARRGKEPENDTIQSFMDHGTIVMDNQAFMTWDNELGHYDETTDWFTGSAWDKETEKIVVKRQASTFIQYKRLDDGQESWVEPCGERLMLRTPTGGILEPPVVGVFGHPEEYRVNDDDDYPYLVDNS